MRACYVMTWVENGNFMWWNFRTQSVFDVVQAWVNAGLNYMQDESYEHRLFNGLRLVARQATYQGV